MLLLDEPTSSLDLHHQLGLLNLITDLAVERRMTVVLAVHDLNLAARFAHRVLVLHGGRIAARGTPAEVLTPDLLREVYRVEARVLHDEDGVPLAGAAPLARPTEGVRPVTESVKELVRRHWEGRAATFDEGASHGLLSDEQRAAWTGRVREWAGPDPVDALDVGCGTGFFALLLAGLGHRPVGVDLADAMLARAREKAAAAGLDVDFRSADAEHLPFTDGSFDLRHRAARDLDAARPATRAGRVGPGAAPRRTARAGGG